MRTPEVIKALIEEALARLKLPADQIVNQLAGSQLPPTGNTGAGYTPASHTHPHTAITDWDEAVQDVIGTKLSGAAPISVAYNDGTGVTTIGFTGSGSGVVRFAASVGNGSSTSFNVVHSIGTQDVVVEVYEVASPYEKVYPDIRHTNSAAIDLVFASAPSSNQYRVVILGVPDPP